MVRIGSFDLKKQESIKNRKQQWGIDSWNRIPSIPEPGIGIGLDSKNFGIEQPYFLASSRVSEEMILVAEGEWSDEMALRADLYTRRLHPFWQAKVPLVCAATQTWTNQASVQSKTGVFPIHTTWSERSNGNLTSLISKRALSTEWFRVVFSTLLCGCKGFQTAFYMLKWIVRHSVDSAPFEIREVRFISYQLARVVPSTFVLYVVVKVLSFFFLTCCCVAPLKCHFWRVCMCIIA